MNAIQYFDWGDNGKEIPFCKVRVKDYFTTQKGRNIERYMPIQGDQSSVILIHLMNPEEIMPIKIHTKSFKIVREGNDIVCNAYIRSNFRTTRKLKAINFVVKFNSRPYIPSLSLGNLYINGRKIKGEGNPCGIGVSYENISFDTTGSTPEKGMIYEDNGESVTFQSLFGKELTIVLS